MRTISPSTAKVGRYRSGPDAENPTDSDSDNVYNIIVIANETGLSDSKEVTITVTNVNDIDPNITSDETASFAENATGVVYTVTATDADLGEETLTYSIDGGVDAEFFTINSTTGEVTFKNPPNYEAPTDYEGDGGYDDDSADVSDNVYEIVVTASDGQRTGYLDVDITVTNVAPSITSDSTASFAENATGVAYTAIANDGDDATPMTYSISGTDSSLFSIDSSTGEVTFNSSPNYEAPADSGSNNVYDITVTASDGELTGDLAVQITVTNANDAPSITSGDTASFAENGTGVAYATSATDEDAGATLTYSLSGTDAGKFSINSSSGAVTFKTPPNYEAPTDSGTDNVYDITVTVTDNGSLSDTQAVAITVTDVTPEYIYGTPGKDNLIGSVDKEIIEGYGDNDTLYGMGGNDSLYGSWGNDSLYGGDGDDYLDGSWDNDILYGGNGNDSLDGSWGDDTLIGGAGGDSLKGGWGKDTFRFDSPSERLDIIQDFKGTEGDIIGIAASGFGGVSKGVLPTTAFRSGAGITTANSTAQRFIYNTTTGALYFDSDGSGGGSPYQIASLTGKPAVSAGNIWIL